MAPAQEKTACVGIASAMAAMARLNGIWHCNTISFNSKFKLCKSRVTCILLYGCETWTLLADSEKKDPGFRNHCTRKLLRIFYLKRKTNDWVRSKVNLLVGPQELLLATVKRRKLAWFGHVTHCNSLFKTILPGTLEGDQHWLEEEMMDGQHQRVDIPAHARAAHKGLLLKNWKRISAESSLMSP